ncbi:hypothetical protein [Nocardia albiluteola]|uniref:hypothetical protein n=1 Tax=Nocardia albiluteola TaxID=2842303 RepID=UPI0035569A5A
MHQRLGSAELMVEQLRPLFDHAIAHRQDHRYLPRDWLRLLRLSCLFRGDGVHSRAPVDDRA